jgi:PAS domain S-box-containing protein/putative nucleotidyltransferase with HDIG domain
MNKKEVLAELSKSRVLIGASIMILMGLYLTSKINFLLFHSLAEVFSILVAFAIFIFFWNARHFLDNTYYLFIGIAFAFVGGIDLLHTLAYSGMGVFAEGGSNLGAQLWIIARFLGASSFLIAPLLIKRKLIAWRVFTIYSVLLVLALATIFYWQKFPVTFIDGVGLTPFKIISEFIIVLLLCFAIFTHYRKRDSFDKGVFHLLVAGIGVGIISELFFTNYLTANEIMNFLGHIFKIFSFFLIYKAFIAVSLTKPYNLLFRELKQTEAILRDSKNKLENIIQLAPVGIGLVVDRVIQEVNGRFCELLGYRPEELVGQNARMVYPNQETFDQVGVEKYEQIRYHGSGILETQLQHKEGHIVDVILSSTAIDENNLGVGVIFTVLDITKRIQDEQALKTSETKFRLLADHTYDWEYWINSEGKYVYLSPACERISGYKPDEFIANPDLIIDITAADYVDQVRRHQTSESENETPAFRMDFPIISKTGERIWLAHHCIAIFDDHGNYVGRRGNNSDISERMRANEKLEHYADQLKRLNSITAALSTILEFEQVLTLILNQIQKLIPYHSANICLYEKNEIKIVSDFGVTPSTKGRSFSIENKMTKEILQSKIPLIINNVEADDRFENWGQEKNIKSWMGIPLTIHNIIIGHINLYAIENNAFTVEQGSMLLPFAMQAAQAIENAKQYHAAELRLERLSEIRKIDQRITSSYDLKYTIEYILSHLCSHLKVDAAEVLIYNKQLQRLNYFHAQGFHTLALRFSSLKLGQGCAGKVALNREDVYIPDLTQQPTGFSESPYFDQEGFISYFGIPLIAKGEMLGVLEVFHRSRLELENELIEYLHTLAGQAAIAIDNITLFEDIQTSNLRLREAYDSTIEGWAHALEMKDIETEGHSRRVVALTLNLAERLGFHGELLQHIRRGALLHDIGKMKVPDTILLKPGKLSEDEWVIMKLHPVYAFDWLSKIEYLQPALNIPHYHHEKWDGSGYPIGLSGNSIPLEARIFAIVDVWDALRSDRPYRKAWSQEQTIDYIKEQSGIHFDPKIVELFLEIITKDDAEY